MGALNKEKKLWMKEKNHSLKYGYKIKKEKETHYLKNPYNIGILEYLRDFRKKFNHLLILKACSREKYEMDI